MLKEKLSSTIIEIIASQKKPTLRTQLVKLVYMVDYLHFRHYGRTITGLDYRWDHHGPNSAPIVSVANDLSKSALRLIPQIKANGDEYFLYSIQDRPSKTSLSEQEQLFIKEVVKDYGNKKLSDLVACSKQTLPFKNARQYESLRFECCEDYETIDHSLRSDENLTKEIADFCSEISEGKEVAGISLAEIEEKYVSQTR